MDTMQGDRRFYTFAAGVFPPTYKRMTAGGKIPLAQAGQPVTTTAVMKASSAQTDREGEQRKAAASVTEPEAAASFSEVYFTQHPSSDRREGSGPASLFLPR